jgi:regulator of sigma E protease
VSFLLAAAGFCALIVLHELGHFAAAKAVGMRVERFALFFGRTPFTFRRGETEYGIGWLPLGGYVKITGMNPAEDIPPEAAHRSYYRQKVWKRIVVIAAGPAVNIAIAFALLTALYAATPTSEPTRNVRAVEPGSPAAAHLRAGDEIVAVDGRRGTQTELTDRINSHDCTEKRVGCEAAVPTQITIRRDGTLRTFEAKPVYDAERDRMRLGFTVAAIEKPPLGIVAAAGQSGVTMWRLTTLTVATIARIFEPEQRRQLSGPVGSYEATRQAIEIDLVRAVWLLALVSLSLGVINLFPFLPLDGGHIFWAVAEKVRGRAIPFRVMERAGIVGVALIAVLFFIGLSNDIGRLTGEGFNFR